MTHLEQYRAAMERTARFHRAPVIRPPSAPCRSRPTFIFLGMYLVPLCVAPRVKLADIQEHVARHFQIPVRTMVDGSAHRAEARPRQVAMYLSRKLTRLSFPQIGRRFGGRDHTTVMYAVKQIESLRLSDPGIAASVAHLSAELQG